MKFRFINNTIKNRRYDYTPMYFDERKERLEAKKKQYARMENGEMTDEERRAIFKSNMRNEWSRAEYRKKARSSANLRTFILVLVIIALGYFIFNGVDQVDTIVKNLW